VLKFVYFVVDMRAVRVEENIRCYYNLFTKYCIAKCIVTQIHVVRKTYLLSIVSRKILESKLVLKTKFV
jgi:hypothetical protein